MLLLLSLACVPGIDDSEVPGLLEADHLLEVELEISDSDWSDLGRERRNLLDLFGGDCMDGPAVSPYTWYPATGRIDGRELGEVGLRKKGFIGSESEWRPSLKIDMDRFVDGGRFGGQEVLTLNNGQQDPSRLDQCLGYELFDRAGVPSPRCQLAHVTVNGEDLGIYVHVESIRPPFFEDRLGDGEGLHWEGSAADFSEGWIGRFEPKNEASAQDPSALWAVREAVQAPDEALLDEVSAVVDLEELERYWATEVLAGHWDGYAQGTNNFHVYLDPATGRFVFVPWGIDALFDSPEPFGAGQPVSVTAHAILAQRLYLHPEGQQRYLDTLDQLMGEVWVEDQLTERLDELAALASPHVLDPDSFEVGVEDVRAYLEEHGEAIRQELDQGPPHWERADREPACLGEVGWVQAEFQTSWGSTEEWDDQATAQMSIDWYGEDLPIQWSSAMAGSDHGTANLAVIGSLGTETYVYPWVFFDEDLVRPGTVSVDWNQAMAYLVYVPPGEEGQLAAYLGEGTLRLDQASTGPGDPVAGELEAAVMGWVPWEGH